MALKIIEDIELDDKGKPVIPFDKEISFIAKGLTVIETFILAVTIGHIEAVAHAPIIFFVLGWIIGFPAILLSWLCGLSTAGLFAGKFSWANSLWTLLKHDGFRAGIVLLWPMLFISRILAGIAEKISYEKRKKACLVLMACIVINSIFLVKLLADSKGKIIFVYGVSLVFYSILAYPRKGNRNKRR